MNRFQQTLARDAIQSLNQRFAPYMVTRDGDGFHVGLATRAAAMTPKSGHLDHLSLEERNAVWAAILVDAKELLLLPSANKQCTSFLQCVLPYFTC